MGVFWRDRRGSVALIFAFTLPALMAAVAGSFEYTRITAYHQRLTSAVELSCSHSAIRVAELRGNDRTRDYSAEVNTLIRSTFEMKKVPAGTYTLQPASVGPLVTRIVVTATGRVDFALASFLPSSNQSLTVTRGCDVSVLSTPPGQSELLLQESFERAHTVANNSWNVLRDWNRWDTTNAGTEINGQPSLTENTMRDGIFFAEMDSDCNTASTRNIQNCQSNSAMTKTLRNLSAGFYQIKYFYLSGKGYINTSGYGTQSICSDLTKPIGSQRGDFASQASTNTYINQAQRDGETFWI